MRKLPRSLAEDRSGIGRLALEPEVIGQRDGAVFQLAAQAAGISQDQPPGPDFAVARECHANGSVNARRGGMRGASGAGDHIFLEFNPLESEVPGFEAGDCSCKVLICNALASNS